MAEHGDLDVLGVLASQASKQHAEESACREVEEGQGHHIGSREPVRFAERLVAGDDQGAILVGGVDRLVDAPSASGPRGAWRCRRSR
jgi:hypothetical protein